MQRPLGAGENPNLDQNLREGLMLPALGYRLIAEGHSEPQGWQRCSAGRGWRCREKALWAHLQVALMSET